MAVKKNNYLKKEDSKKEDVKLTYEIPIEIKIDDFTLNGLKYTNENPENDGLYTLSKIILEKWKYRKLFLSNSFNEYILKKIHSSINNLKNSELDSYPVKWLTIYKWMLRKRIPYIDNFENVKVFISRFEDIPFFKEWGMSIDLMCNDFKEWSKSIGLKKEEFINFIDALKVCHELKLVNIKYCSIFCQRYNAHIVYDSSVKSEFLKDGVIHNDCDGNSFNGCIYEITHDFYEFWFRTKGKTCELWFYYVLLYYLSEHKKCKNYSIYRNIGVSYNDPTKPITEIDIMVVLDNKIIPCECKNKDISMEMILKFYGTLKMLKFEYGIFACTTKFNEYIIPKEEVFKKFGILIIDDLLYKDKNTIFKELEKII